MFYTRFGSRVDIIAVFNQIEEPGWVVVKYVDFAGQREVHISDLRANGGMPEIMQFIDKLQNQPKS